MKAINLVYVGIVFVWMAALGAAGCGESALKNPEWEIVYEDPADKQGVVWVETTILTGGCDGTLLFSQNIFADGGVSDPTQTPPILTKGKYGFRGRARSATCTYSVVGCTDVDLPTKKPIQVVLKRVTNPIAACPAERCENGTCITAVIDAAVIDAGTDADHDGSFLPADCNDGDATIYPGATEACDGKDNDCDNMTDEDGQSVWYYDSDHDGYGDAGISMMTCMTMPVDYVSNGTDCYDSDATIHPGAAEVCNGRDDNCDSNADEGNTCPATCVGKYNAGHSYMFCSAQQMWSAAFDTCASQTGFKLVRINDAAENTYVRDTASAAGFGDLWTGGINPSGDTWVWVERKDSVGGCATSYVYSGTAFWTGNKNGSAVGGLYNNWETDNPSRGSETIVEMKPNGKWNDDEGDRTQPFVCEQY